VLVPLDVLIVDEAHRLRNPETLQHKVGTVLTRSATPVVFLTATPVQNKLEDLWNLLKLLSPDEFSEWALFQDQVKGNRLILAAQTALASHPPDFEEAKGAVESFIRQHAPERAGRAAEFLPAELWSVKPLRPQGSAPDAEAAHACHRLLAAG
jgi:hypothetical protein